MKKTTKSKATKSLRRGKKLAKQTTLKPVQATESLALNFSKVEIKYQPQ